MKNAILGSSLLVLSIGCSGSGAKASAAECSSGCERVAELRLAPQKAQMATKVHEADEQVDSTEEESARQTALLKQQLVEGGPPWNPKAFAKQPAKTRRELEARHEWEARQLKLQRELALQRIEGGIAEAKKHYQEVKTQGEADEQKATGEAMKACIDPCLRRPANFARCLQRAQAVEDLEICEKR